MRPILWIGLVALGGCSLMYPLGDELASGSDVDAGEDASPPQTTPQKSDGGEVEDSGDPVPPDASDHDRNAPPDADVDAGTDAGTVSRYTKEVLADAPIVYLRLGDSAGTTADSTIGPSGTYSLVGLSFGAAGALAGDPDTAMRFTNGTGAITMPPGADFSGNKPYSIEVWIRPSASNTALGFTVDHQIYSGGRAGWLLRAGTDQIAFERWGNGDSSSLGTSKGPTTGVWQHVVGVYDGTTAYLFVNGALIESRDVSLALPARGTSYSIGHQNAGGASNSFVGDLDELAIYDKALIQTRIAAHYAAAK